MIKCLKCNKSVKGRIKGLCNNCHRLYKQSLLPKILCFCGCGELIPSLTLDNKPSKYKKGHSSKGKNNPSYNNGISNDKEYIIISKPNHPFVRTNGFVPAHRLVYEHYLKILFDEDIYIPKNIEIDHINKNKQDNSLINLRPLYKGQHTKRHIDERKEQRIKYMNKIFCNLCNGKTTYNKYNGEIWIKDLDGYLCRNCYEHIRRLRKRLGLLPLSTIAPKKLGYKWLSLENILKNY